MSKIEGMIVAATLIMGVGCTGAAGNDGPRGEAGVPGRSITITQLEHGGACAYGGTQFSDGVMTSLACNGTPGERGPIGPQGAQGEVGAQGEQGAIGPQGVQGIQGVAGQAVAPPSFVAVAWTLSISGVNYLLHLNGTDASITGAWMNSMLDQAGSASSGQLSGGFSDGVIRLELTRNDNTNGIPWIAYLVDCAVSADGNSAAGTAQGLYSVAPTIMMRTVDPSPP